jgi:hypothetical protein
MANYSVGDINVEKLLVSSRRGTLDLSKSFVSASIYESILTPGTVCDIVVLDTQDQLGTLKLIGDETIDVILSIPGTSTAPFRFALYELGNLESKGSQNSKQYTLRGVSREAMFAKTNYVQKGYSMLCSDMIKDIHKNYLNSSKPLVLENTQSPQNIIIPHMTPYKAINLIRLRSISNVNKSSSFVYFENRQNEKQSFNFVTIEQMFRGTTVKSFQQSTAINTDIKNRTDNNILAYFIPNQFSSIERIGLGGPTKVTTFDFTTQQFVSNIINSADNFATGGSGKTMVSIDFQNTYYNAKIPPQALIPVDISQRPSTNIPEGTSSQQAFLTLLVQNSIKIRVPGDTVLTAGIMVNCEIPNKTGTTGPRSNDPLLSGKFLVSRIHHRIGMFKEQPRYTCIIELIKAGYNQGV